MKNKNLGKQIVVIDNGFVHVGDCSLEGGFLRIVNCKNIRAWGTTKGISELASGPTKSTVSDQLGVALVPLGRVVFFIQVSTGAWE